MAWIDKSNGQSHQGGSSGPDCGRGVSGDVTKWVETPDGSGRKQDSISWTTPDSGANVGFAELVNRGGGGTAAGWNSGIPAGSTRGLAGYSGHHHRDMSNVPYAAGWEPRVETPAAKGRKALIATAVVAALALIYVVPQIVENGINKGEQTIDNYLEAHHDGLLGKLVKSYVLARYEMNKPHPYGEYKRAPNSQRDPLIREDAHVVTAFTQADEAGKKRIHEQVILDENGDIAYVRDRMPELVGPLKKNLDTVNRPYEKFLYDHAEELAPGYVKDLNTPIGRQARALHEKIEATEYEAMRKASTVDPDRPDFSEKAR